MRKGSNNWICYKRFESKSFEFARRVLMATMWLLDVPGGHSVQPEVRITRRKTVNTENRTRLGRLRVSELKVSKVSVESWDGKPGRKLGSS